MAITMANAIGCRKGRKIQQASARAPTSKARRNKTLAIELGLFTRKPGGRLNFPGDRQCILSRLRRAIAGRNDVGDSENRRPHRDPLNRTKRTPTAHRACSEPLRSFQDQSEHYFVVPVARRFPDWKSAGAPAILQANIRKDGAVRSSAGSIVE